MADIQKNKRRKKQSKENEFLIQGAILAAAAVIVKIIGALYRIPLTNIIGDEGNGVYSAAFEIYNILLIIVPTPGLFFHDTLFHHPPDPLLNFLACPRKNLSRRL